MYSSYGNYPLSTSNMNYSYGSNYGRYSGNYGSNDDRVGGFLFPFVLGGITGGLLAPAFYPRPYYYQPYPYYPYYPYYR